ncbi:MAG: hypothetical protein RLZZ507_828 [Cyanobacteriota bacterium]|jgi:glutathione S-transferase
MHQFLLKKVLLSTSFLVFIFQSIQHLSEKYQKIPTPLVERAKIEQWVIFANATLAPALFIAEKREKEIPVLLTALNQILQQQQFVLGKKLTAGDIAVAYYLYAAKILLSVNYNQYPGIVSYLDQISAREHPNFEKITAATPKTL